MSKNQEKADISFSFDGYEIEEFQSQAGNLPIALCDAVDVLACLTLLRDMREQLGKWESEIKTMVNCQVNGL